MVEVIPDPVPALFTVREYLAGTTVNVAVTVLLSFIKIIQVFPETEVHPVQPVKVEPTSGVAVMVAVESVR